MTSGIRNNSEKRQQITCLWIVVFIHHCLQQKRITSLPRKINCPIMSELTSLVIVSCHTPSKKQKENVPDAITSCIGESERAREAY